MGKGGVNLRACFGSARYSEHLNLGSAASPRPASRGRSTSRSDDRRKGTLPRGADCLATVCPLCQFNLECYQDTIQRELGANVALPIVYLTQLIGQAFGLSDTELGLQRLFVPAARPAVQEGGKAAHA